MKRFFTLILLVLMANNISISAQKLRMTVNHENGIYAKGEKAVVTCHSDTAIVDTLTVRVYNNNRLTGTTRVLPTGTDFEVFAQAYDSTCAVMVEVETGKKLKESAGFVVAPEGFRAGYTEPEDLMPYWENQKKLLKALPMQVKTTPLDVPQQYEGKYTCQDVEINCLGPAPVRAYMAKPAKAKKKSLPIIILCRAAGVSGNWCRCQVGECVGNAAQGNGALSLDLNAHGMLNGQSDEYYKMLEDGMLVNYYNQNVVDREMNYFRGMYLRLLRAIEYMTKQPEWDGKRILVIGESQGGGQAAAAAGLDNRVSAVVLTVPAIQDLGGAMKGRRSGWPQPIECHSDVNKEEMARCLPYFDCAMLLRHSKAEIVCEIGLIDTTCPPSSVWASMNGAPGRKTVRCAPFRTHSWPSQEWFPYWNEHYHQPRLQFISDYLK